MNTTNTTTSLTMGGTGFLNALFITFLVLKLTKTIDWSWWWVTSPLWIPFALVMATGLTFVVIAIIAAGLVDREHRWLRDDQDGESHA